MTIDECIRALKQSKKQNSHIKNPGSIEVGIFDGNERLRGLEAFEEGSNTFLRLAPYKDRTYKSK